MRDIPVLQLRAKKEKEIPKLLSFHNSYRLDKIKIYQVKNKIKIYLICCHSKLNQSITKSFLREGGPCLSLRLKRTSCKLSISFFSFFTSEHNILLLTLKNPCFQVVVEEVGPQGT
jgi:hypothetical protein